LKAAAAVCVAGRSVSSLLPERGFSPHGLRVLQRVEYLIGIRGEVRQKRDRWVGRLQTEEQVRLFLLAGLYNDALYYSKYCLIAAG